MHTAASLQLRRHSAYNAQSVLIVLCAREGVKVFLRIQKLVVYLVHAQYSQCNLHICSLDVCPLKVCVNPKALNNKDYRVTTGSSYRVLIFPVGTLELYFWNWNYSEYST